MILPFYGMPTALICHVCKNVLLGSSMTDGTDKVNVDSIQVKTNIIQMIIWNVLGLHDGGKKHMVLEQLKRLSADVVFLREFHFFKGEM